LNWLRLKGIKAKVGLLELANSWGNVADACRLMGYGRDSFRRKMAESTFLSVETSALSH
jgi:hypothetical protein